jgi:hypothetical protein
VISRRGFLRGLVGGAGAVGVALGTRWRLSHSTPSSTPDPLAALGRSYLSKYPKEDSLDVLRRSTPELSGARSAADVRAALPAIAAAAAADFASGEVVQIEGWRLTRTEARAAAAVELLDR